MAVPRLPFPSIKQYSDYAGTVARRQRGVRPGTRATVAALPFARGRGEVGEVSVTRARRVGGAAFRELLLELVGGAILLQPPSHLVALSIYHSYLGTPRLARSWVPG